VEALRGVRCYPQRQLSPAGHFLPRGTVLHHPGAVLRGAFGFGEWEVGEARGGVAPTTDFREAGQ